MEHLLKLIATIRAWGLVFPMRALQPAADWNIKVASARHILSQNTMEIAQLSQNFYEEVPISNIYQIQSGATMRKKRRAVEVIAKHYPRGTAEFLDPTASTISCDFTGLDKVGTKGYRVEIKQRVETTRGFSLPFIDWRKSDNYGTIIGDLENMLYRQLQAMDEKIGNEILKAARSFRKPNTHSLSDVIVPQGNMSYIAPEYINADLIGHMQPLMAVNGMDDAIIYDGHVTSPQVINDQFKEIQTGNEAAMKQWRALRIHTDFHQFMKLYPNEMMAIRPNSIFVATFADYGEGKEGVLSEDLVLTTIPSPSFAGITYDLIIKRKCGSSEGTIDLTDNYKLACNLTIFNNPNHTKENHADILVFQKKRLYPAAAPPPNYTLTYEHEAIVPTFHTITIPADALVIKDFDGNVLVVEEGTLTIRENNAVGDVVASGTFDKAVWNAQMQVNGLKEGNYSVRWEGKVTMNGSTDTIEFYTTKDIYVPCDNCR